MFLSLIHSLLTKNRNEHDYGKNRYRGPNPSSPHARAFVAEKLIESLDIVSGEDLSPAWRDEVRKRCHEMDEGKVELLHADDVFAKA